jgi:hypothetical protein
MTLKGGVYRVTWIMEKMAADTTWDDPIKMSELIRDVDTGDEAVAFVKARYTHGERVKILSVAQLR